MNKFTNWLSNKWNLIGVCALCYLLIGIILYGKLPSMELVIIYLLVSVCSWVVYILGIGRGMFLHAVNNDIHEFLKRIREEAAKDDE